uniref:FYVE-type domain-containing protein n=1 Tax=Phytophthora ramorum TaxID=164328 RepID=H3GZP1_PHYRM
MGKERFQSNPYPGLVLSKEDHALLLDLTNTLVQQNFEKYQHFVQHDKRRIDLDRWKLVKSRNDIHIHVRREDPEELQVLQARQSTNTPVMLSVGTFPGKMDDLMLGVMNPTLDTMRMKASYVHDVNDAAILAPIIVPTGNDPFLSVVVKWMQRDLPLESTNLIKNRDFIYVEATGILHFTNGERVGYHLMHSIDFPQTRPLRNVVRGNLSICCMFRQLCEHVIDNHSFSTLEPGGELLRFLMLPIAAECLLSATNYEPCGQMTKLTWLMQRRRAQRSRSTTKAAVCVTCTRNFSRKLGRIGSSTCKICFNAICFSCKIQKRVSMIAPDGKMLQPKITFCASCASEASSLDAMEVARDMTKAYDPSKLLHASSLATSSSFSDSYSDHSWPL